MPRLRWQKPGFAHAMAAPDGLMFATAQKNPSKCLVLSKDILQAQKLLASRLLFKFAERDAGDGEAESIANDVAENGGCLKGTSR